MRTIHKYILPVGTLSETWMPQGAKVHHVAEQSGELTLWAEVDTACPVEPRGFAVFGTGHVIPEDFEGEFIGTVLMHGGRLVLHVYEVTL